MLADISNVNAIYIVCGQKKLRQIVEEHADADFVLRNGAKVQIKRKKIENFIDQTSCI